MSADRVRAALHAAATHQPDRTAILARIERGKVTLDPARTARAGHRRTAVRMVGMAATVAAVLGFGAAVTWAAVGTDVLRKPPREPVVAAAPVSSSPRAAPGPTVISRAPSASHGSSHGSSHASSHAPPSPAPSHTSPSPVVSPSAEGGQQGFLRSSGAVEADSVDNWAQGKVTVVTTETLTVLEVSVRVVATPQLSSTGAWSTVLAKDLTTTVEQQPDALVYRFTLKPGAHLGPGSYVFGLQYNHAVGGREPDRDTYHAVATAGGTRVEVDGGF